MQLREREERESEQCQDQDWARLLIAEASVKLASALPIFGSNNLSSLSGSNNA